MTDLPLPPNPASSIRLTVWITTGRSVIVWLSGGGPISRLSWCDLCFHRWPALTCLLVSLRPCPHHETQGMQETFPCSDAREESVFHLPTNPRFTEARYVQRFWRFQKT